MKREIEVSFQGNRYTKTADPAARQAATPGRWFVTLLAAASEALAIPSLGISEAIGLNPGDVGDWPRWLRGSAALWLAGLLLVGARLYCPSFANVVLVAIAVYRLSPVMRRAVRLRAGLRFTGDKGDK